MNHDLLLGSLALSLLHATIPNHWLPVVAIGKRLGWSGAKTSRITILAGSAHVLSTVLIGILVSIVGWQLSEWAEWVMEVAAPLLLVVLGGGFIWRHYYHRHFHLHGTVPEDLPERQLVVVLAAAMFMSPCLEVSPLFLLAGAHGVSGVFGLVFLYAFTTVAGMVVWVQLVWRGLKLSNWHALEHYSGIISGVVLMATGLWGLFLKT